MQNTANFNDPTIHVCIVRYCVAIRSEIHPNSHRSLFMQQEKRNLPLHATICAHCSIQSSNIPGKQVGLWLFLPADVILQGLAAPVACRKADWTFSSFFRMPGGGLETPRSHCEIMGWLAPTRRASSAWLKPDDIRRSRIHCAVFIGRGF
jgi:hypothetical protein